MNDFDQLSVPGPTVTSTSERFWEAVDRGSFEIQQCDDCGAWIFYPRVLCPSCWSENLTWREASGRGTLRTYSTVERPGHPGWAPAAPYVVALVTLEEGPTMLTLLIHDRNGQAPALGSAVAFSPTEISGRRLPTFQTTSTGGKTT